MSHEHELLALLAQRFPALVAGGTAQVEQLGVYAAQSWSAGTERLAAAGVRVPAAVHAGLAQGAAQVAGAQRGGLTFLAHLRVRLQSDGEFLAGVEALGRAWGRARGGGAAAGAAPNTGTKPAAAPEPRTVAVAGFEVFEKLGEGNMGRVFKARQKSLDRTVALKVLNRSLAEDDETFVARFELEAKSAARLQHPNIVTVFDAGSCPRTGVQFIAMELVVGESAGGLLEKQGKLPEREALSLCLAMTEALNCAEQHGIVHRDLKPDNILVGDDGIPRLTDLGLAKKREAKEITSDGLIVGTPHYMAPEQALGVKDVDGRADLYSLGITLFQLITGRMPFESESAIGVITMHINEDVPELRRFEPSASPGTSQLVSHLCARDRARRYPTARAAGEDIQRVLAGQTPLGPEAAARAAEESAASSGRIRVASISGAFAGGSGVGAARVRPVELTPPPDLDPFEQALWRFARTGYAPYLEEAEQAAGSGGPAAQARAARVALLRGDAEGAGRRAQGALQNDPTSREALEVLAALEAGDAAAAPFRAALLRLSSQVAANRAGDARSVGATLRRDFPAEPHPHLALALVAAQAGDEAAFREAVQLAWALFPSRQHAMVPLGCGVDLPCAEALIAYGRAAFGSGDPARMLQTVQATEDKSNLVAGALRMGVGTLHAALAAAPLDALILRRHLLALARGLAALQYLNHAQEVLARLRTLGPDPDEARVVDEEERAIAGLRGVTQAGVQPQRGRFPCPVGRERGDWLRARGKLLERRLKELHTEVDGIGDRLAALGLEDPAVAQELRAAAQACARPDPFATLEGLDHELEETARELGAVGDSAPTERKTGFFAAIKGAADAAGRAAKTGQLKLRETQLRMARNKAVKALGVEAAHALNAGAYRHPELAASSRRARHLLACAAQVEGELDALRARVAALG
ncbi:MAG: serine/threonine-protein kinase [Planctomycetota bacterium]